MVVLLVINNRLCLWNSLRAVQSNSTWKHAQGMSRRFFLQITISSATPCWKERSIKNRDCGYPRTVLESFRSSDIEFLKDITKIWRSSFIKSFMKKYIKRLKRIVYMYNKYCSAQYYFYIFSLLILRLWSDVIICFFTNILVTKKNFNFRKQTIWNTRRLKFFFCTYLI